MDELNSYDSVLGGQSMEAVEAETSFINRTARPRNPFRFSGDAAEANLQSTYNQFTKSIYEQFDEDAKVVDALQSMMTAVDQRITDGEN